MQDGKNRRNCLGNTVGSQGDWSRSFLNTEGNIVVQGFRQLDFHPPGAEQAGIIRFPEGVGILNDNGPFFYNTEVAFPRGYAQRDIIGSRHPVGMLRRW